MVARQDHRLHLAPGQIPFALENERGDGATLECTGQIDLALALAHDRIKVRILDPLVESDPSEAFRSGLVVVLALPVAVDVVVVNQKLDVFLARPPLALAMLAQLGPDLAHPLHLGLGDEIVLA